MERLRRIFEQTDEIKQILFEKQDSREAFGRMKSLIAQLDKSMKEETRVESQKISEEFKKVGNLHFLLLGETAFKEIYINGTLRLLSKLYSLIYEKYDLKSMIGMKQGVKP